MAKILKVDFVSVIFRKLRKLEILRKVGVVGDFDGGCHGNRFE
jgi:hypothetical protein